MLAGSETATLCETLPADSAADRSIRYAVFPDMKLTLGAEPEAKDPAPTQVSSALSRLDGTGDSFAIFERARMEYLQTSGRRAVGRLPALYLGLGVTILLVGPPSW